MYCAQQALLPCSDSSTALLTGARELHSVMQVLLGELCLRFLVTQTVSL